MQHYGFSDGEMNGITRVCVTMVRWHNHIVPMITYSHAVGRAKPWHSAYNQRQSQILIKLCSWHWNQQVLVYSLAGLPFDVSFPPHGLIKPICSFKLIGTCPVLGALQMAVPSIIGTPLFSTFRWEVFWISFPLSLNKHFKKQNQSRNVITCTDLITCTEDKRV